MTADGQTPAPEVAIVGGGLAGLAAAVTLADRGFKIDLLEARRQLGGRATSFRDAASGQLIDHCQHVSLGCCTNLTDFCRRTGLADLLSRHHMLHFFGPDGRRCDVAASRWLPAPLHLLPSLLRLKYLTLKERLQIIWAMRKLARTSSNDDPQGPTIGQWLHAHRQTARAIELFWEPVIVSALSESVDRAAIPPVRKVFVDAFLSNRNGYELQIPQVPLGEFYGQRLERWISEHGINLRLECSVKQLIGDAAGIHEVELADGKRLQFDAVVLAVPWRRVSELLSEPVRASLPELQKIEQIESAPISAVHLWFDRPITELSHAVLPGRTSQWLFNRGEQPLANNPTTPAARAHYYQIVISASRNLASQPREQVVEQVLQELAAVWSAVSDAQLLQSRFLTEQHAVFSVRPGVDSLRPLQTTKIPNLFLAGDWTATGWPSTMEGAVRSGYLAAEGIWAFLKQPTKLLTPDLAPSWLMRRLIG